MLVSLPESLCFDFVGSPGHISLFFFPGRENKYSCITPRILQLTDKNAVGKYTYRISLQDKSMVTKSKIF